MDKSENAYISTLPQISCIVPVYNTEKYINRCIESIISQTFADFELILIDDGSSDNCGKICDEYATKDRRIKVIHQQNAGVSAARNAGLDMVQGEYVCFVDSDDWVEVNYLETLLKMITISDYDVAICGFVGEKRRKPKVFNKLNAIRKIFSQNGYGGFSQKRIIPLELINRFPQTRYNESITYLEDSEFFFRLFNKCRSVYWNNFPIYHYERNKDSVTNEIGITTNVLNGYKTLEKLINEEKNKSIKKILEICYLDFKTIKQMIGLIDKKEFSSVDKKAFSFLRKELRHNCFKTSFFLCSELTLKKKILVFLLIFVPISLIRSIVRQIIKINKSLHASYRSLI